MCSCPDTNVVPWLIIVLPVSNVHQWVCLINVSSYITLTTLKRFLRIFTIFPNIQQGIYRI